MIFHSAHAVPSVTLREAVGLTCGPYEVYWTVNDTITLALATGMAPPDDLEYLYEGRGPRVLPTLAGVICGVWFVPLLDQLHADRNAAVHGETRLTLARDVPAEGKAHVSARIVGVDTRRPHACLVVEAEAKDEAGTIAIVRSLSFLRGMGGADWVEGDVSRVVRCENGEKPQVRSITVNSGLAAAAIYRLLFPLRAGQPYADAAHIDPARSQRAGYTQPVLHGLTILGMGARAIIKAYGGTNARFLTLAGRFVRGVTPGSELHALVWKEAIDRWVAELCNPDDQTVMCHVDATLERSEISDKATMDYKEGRERCMT